MEAITKGGFRGMVNRIRSMKSRLDGAREKGEMLMGQVFQTLEVAGGAAAWGYANGKWGPREFFGVQADLLTGVALHGVSLFGVFGKHASHGHNLGDASLAAWGYRTGNAKGLAAANPSTGYASAGQFAGGTGYASASAFQQQGTGYASASNFQPAGQ